MATQGAQFNPQGAKEVTVRGLGPALGKTIAVGGGSVPQQVSGGPSGNQIAPAPAPRGAQPVTLAGNREEPRPVPAPARQAPRQMGTAPFFGPKNPQGAKHIVSVVGMSPEGKEFVAEVVFPSGSRVMGVTEREEG